MGYSVVQMTFVPSYVSILPPTLEKAFELHVKLLSVLCSEFFSHFFHVAIFHQVYLAVIRVPV